MVDKKLFSIFNIDPFSFHKLDSSQNFSPPERLYLSLVQIELLPTLFAALHSSQQEQQFWTSCLQKGQPLFVHISL
jgi:hypothetical protein